MLNLWLKVRSDSKIMGFCGTWKSGILTSELLLLVLFTVSALFIHWLSAALVFGASMPCRHGSSTPLKQRGYCISFWWVFFKTLTFDHSEKRTTRSKGRIFLDTKKQLTIPSVIFHVRSPQWSVWEHALFSYRLWGGLLEVLRVFVFCFFNNAVLHGCLIGNW